MPQKCLALGGVFSDEVRSVGDVHPQAQENVFSVSVEEVSADESKQAID